MPSFLRNISAALLIIYLKAYGREERVYTIFHGTGVHLLDKNLIDVGSLLGERGRPSNEDGLYLR